MIIAVDWDGTCVSQDRPYSDIVTPPEFIPGAKEALLALKRAGHLLVLWSGRANRALLFDPLLDPLVRSGVKPVNRRAWLESRHLNLARYHQMIEIVNRELPGVFDAIDDGSAGKFSFDLVIDDKAMVSRGPATWARIARAYGESEPLFEPGLPPELLDTPVERLDLVPTGTLKDILDRVRADLRAAGIVHFEPNYILGSASFFAVDRATTVNLPWWLATPELWNASLARYPWTPENVERSVRHETGHSVNYAFELWKRADWTATFGNFTLPYPAASPPADRPQDPDCVRYMLDVPPAYASRHPDEAWAEAFAAWLDPSEDTSNLTGEARRKIEYVERMAADVMAGYPTNLETGALPGYKSGYRGQTVRMALGIPVDSAVKNVSGEQR